MPHRLSDERRTTYHVTTPLQPDGSLLLQIEERVWARCDTGFGGGWWEINHVSQANGGGEVLKQRGYKRRGGLMTTDEIEEFSTSVMGAAMTYRESLEEQLIEAKQAVTRLKASIQAADDAVNVEWEQWRRDNGV
jgi:hypothetical protein